MSAKYKVIYDYLRNGITDGTFKTGSKLPDELTICSEFNCSRMTAKKAYDMLVSEGLIYRRQGQGSFVLAKQQDLDVIDVQERQLEGLSRTSHGRSKSHVIRFGLIFATKEIADKLNINENDPVYDILRLRIINDKPYTLEQTYMSPALIPGITQDVLNESIYSYIENELGLKIASAQKTSRADISNDLDHEYLKLKDIEPVLEVEQVAYLDNGKPFEYSFSRHRYDLFTFSSYSVRR